MICEAPKVSWVYPRVGGGTFRCRGSCACVLQTVYPRVGGGTASEPWTEGIIARKRVYPRVGGGTAESRQVNGPLFSSVYPRRVGGGTMTAFLASTTAVQGLSPRGRGNLGKVWPSV